MFLYRRPELLTADKHGDLGVSRPEKPMAFTLDARAVPITLNEFGSASRHYPIVFVGDTLTPLAVISIVDGKNLFLQENGMWSEDAYVPAYLRRYPFALAGDEAGDRFALVFDAEYEGVKKGGDTPFFTNGQPTESMQGIVEFCREYERNRRITEDFSKRLKDLDIITSQTANFTAPGDSTNYIFAQYEAVAEEKFQELADDVFLELRKSNMLPFIYAQMMSMGNWRNLLERRARQKQMTTAAVVEELKALNTPASAGNA